MEKSNVGNTADIATNTAQSLLMPTLTNEVG